MKKINKIIIRHIPDYDADLDWIGTFDREPQSEFAIEHEPDNNRTYNWFNPQKGAVENKKQAKRDYERLLAYDRGDWGMIGIKAEAHIACSLDGKTWKLDTITSGGLWGIETDADEKYHNEIEQEQLAELKDYLKEYGFTDEEIEKAEVVIEN
jgi:hypothetical protein